MLKTTVSIRCPGCGILHRTRGTTLGLQSINNIPKGTCRSCSNSVIRSGVSYTYFSDLVKTFGTVRAKRLLILARIVRDNAKKRDRHKDRGNKWILSVPQLILLVTAPCAYCGFQKFDGPILRNQIDRVLSKRGYILGNVLPCCKYHNWGKNSMPLEEFCMHFNINAIKRLTPKKIKNLAKAWEKKLEREF